MDAAGERVLNPDAARRAARQTRDRERLAAVRRAAEAIAVGSALVGDVPGGDAARTALAETARSLWDELAATGATVEDISRSAVEVARIADATDRSAHDRLAAARPGGRRDQGNGTEAGR
jgi:hypothetical protein